MIAISYRREDTAPITGRIYDRLETLFGRDQVFMDLDSIPFGVDFRTHISESLSRCDTLLVVIGPRWLGVSADGSRRIDDPMDFVRLEVTQALSLGIRVIPLLIDRTEMPSSTVLPDDLKEFAFLNALRVDSGADFRHHMGRLCSSLESPTGRGSSPPARSYQPTATTSASEAPPRSTLGPTVSPREPAQLQRSQTKTFFFKTITFVLLLVSGILTALSVPVFMVPVFMIDSGSDLGMAMLAGGFIMFVTGFIGLCTTSVPPHLKRRQ